MAGWVLIVWRCPMCNRLSSYSWSLETLASGGGQTAYGPVCFGLSGGDYGGKHQQVLMEPLASQVMMGHG